MSKITIPKPAWHSSLASIVLDLEKLRTKELYSEISVHIFFQIKSIFQILETLGSARIEGNHTTLLEYVERILENKARANESQQEIDNLDKGIKFVEENTDENTPISRIYLSELHKIVTKNLTPPPRGEGSVHPGYLRKHNIKITKAKHTPPDMAILQDYWDSFIKFVNQNHPAQDQLLMVAIAHHRFAYMHPFDNGNGRVGRLLNYALLIKQGFKVKKGRIINPSSVFYSDRDKYYNMLSKADSLSDKDTLAWIEYFLKGLKSEIKKIDSLLNNQFIKSKILLPTIKFALERENITKQENNILKYLVKKDDISMKTEELENFGITGSVQKSRIMTKLKNKKIIKATTKGGRIYTINFVNSYLLRGVMHSLEKEGFISDFLNKN